MAAGDLFQDGNKTVQEQLRDALVKNSMRVTDLFREWDENVDGDISREEFRKAMGMLGMHASAESINAVFDEFDCDGNGTISFRELNRKLRRDVKAEVKKEEAKPAEAIEIANVDSLRKQVKQRLIAFSNVDVAREIDPLTGKPREQKSVWDR